MIEYDKSEHSYSDFDDDTLLLIELLMGPEIRNKLLITPEQVRASVRLYSRNNKRVI
ncbi:hypothetical protein [Paenibacillus taiwanensis]|uniref:hypothetical protein n=1 Tax=Paenibacillus taiwanensis TaxID=401638 RepID=UPI0003FB3F9D|nr:hypothetical protein [Paenibacillus taiwanensis]